MRLKRFAIGAVALSLATMVYTQTTQTSQSSSGSQSSGGSSSAWGSASGSAGGSASGGSSVGGSAGGSAFGSQFAMAGGKPTHAILYKLESGNPDTPAAGRAFDMHTRHLSEHRSKGKVFLFGPWRDHPGSMAIVIAKSDEEAVEIAKSDPAVRSGALSFEVRAWNVGLLAGNEARSSRVSSKSGR